MSFVRSTAVPLALLVLLCGPGRAEEQAGFPTLDFERGKAELPGLKVLLGPGAALRATTVNTAEAGSGEWYLEIDGVNHSTQYGLRVDNVPVAPNARYVLSFRYRMSEHYRPNAFILMVFQFDRQRHRVAAKYYYPAPRQVATKWTDYRTQIETGPKAEKILIFFRQEHVLPGTKLWLDDIGLKRGDPTLFVRWEIDPRQAVLSGEAIPSSDVAGQVSSCRAMILREETIVKSAKLAPGQQQFRFELRDLVDDVSYYLSAVALLNDGRVLGQRLSEVKLGRHRLRVRLPEGPETDLEVTDKDNLFYTYVKSRPWEGNRIGALGPQEMPPRPWSPVVADAKTGEVRTWNNRFLPSPDLGQMRIRFDRPAGELTSEPIRLAIDGRPISEQFQFTPARVLQAGPNTVVLQSTGSRDGVQVEARATIEFDGFLRYRLAIRPAAGRPYRLGDLSLRLPFAKDYVRFYCTERGLKHEPSYATRRFFPSLWFGNFETGVCWCAERLVPSVREQEREWLSLKSEPEGSTLRIQLVNKPVEVRGEPLVVEFGLLPTPCRPFDPRMRNEHFRSELHENTHYLEFATLEELRATLAAPWGPAHMFLPQYWQREKAADRRLMGQVGALAMVHDALPFVAHQEVLEKMMRRKYDFGDLSRAEWWPYWQANPYLAADNSAVVVSSYHRDGELFVIPWNISHRPQRLVLGLTERFPGPHQIKVYDPVEDRDAVGEVRDGRFELELAPYCTKLVTVRKP